MATLIGNFISSTNASPGLSSSKLNVNHTPSHRFSQPSMNIFSRMHFPGPQCQIRPVPSTDRNDVGGLTLLNIDSVSDCRQIHSQVGELNALRIDGLFGKKLGTFYAKNVKCMKSDGNLFDESPERTLPEYAALIRACCRSENWNELFVAFRGMVDEGFLPNEYLIPTILKACSKRQMVRTGKMVHGYVIRSSLVSDTFIGNALIDFYSNCVDLRYSINVFDSMTEKDVITWTTLVSAYVEEGLLDEAMKVFHSMQSSGLEPDLISWNALIVGFARQGEIDITLQHLEAMREKGLSPGVNSWNGIISGCVQNGYFKEALDMFHNMLLVPTNPNSVTVASILPACVGLKDLDLGRAIHAYALKCKLSVNIYVEGSLVDMYSKCGLDDYAEKLFTRAEKKNIALWNEIIAAHVNQGKTSKALEHFRTMKHHGIEPDVITYNTLLAGYAKKGKKIEVYKLLSEMSQKGITPNVVSLNALISGFQQHGLSYEALKLFKAMLPSGCISGIIPPTRPNSVTITSDRSLSVLVKFRFS